MKVCNYINRANENECENAHHNTNIDTNANINNNGDGNDSEKKKGKIVVISAISGSGKSSVIKELISRNKNCVFSVSYTTRGMRDGEMEGKDYRFISEDQFYTAIEKKDMIEYVMLHNNLYGTGLSITISHLEQSHNVIFDVDYYGYKNIHDKFQDSNIDVVGIWIEVDKDTIIQRLIERGGEEHLIEQRVKFVHSEYDYHDSIMKKKYDYVVKNTNLHSAVSQIESIIQNL